MLILCSAKGGSGTTVVAASLALLHAQRGPCLLVDLAGDLPAALGIAEPPGPGVHDWLSSSVADAASLLRLAVEVTDGLRLIPCGSVPASADAQRVPAERWDTLGMVLSTAHAMVVVDAGTGGPHPALLPRAERTLLVTRSCYLSLRRVARLGFAPSGAVLVQEPGRALRRADVEHALGTPVVAEVPWDPAVARMVDAGILASRLPTSISRPLRAAA
ncbi:MAG: cellulose synthase operon protein YhjQ/BcsQ [Ilumatobacteraceae bacterium]